MRVVKYKTIGLPSIRIPEMMAFASIEVYLE